MKKFFIAVIVGGSLFGSASAYAGVTDSAVKAAIGAFISNDNAESVTLTNSIAKADVEVEDSWVIGSNLGNRSRAETFEMDHSEAESIVKVRNSKVFLSNLGNDFGGS